MTRRMKKLRIYSRTTGLASMACLFGAMSGVMKPAMAKRQFGTDKTQMKRHRTENCHRRSATQSDLKGNRWLTVKAS